MRKFSIDDTVYIIDGSRIKKAKIDGIKKKRFSGFWCNHEEIVYEILGKEYQAEEIYETKSEVFLKLIEVLVFEDKKEDNIPFEKLQRVCKYLFPEDFEDELEDKDFESTGSEKVLKIDKPREGKGMIMISDKTKQFIKIHTNRYSNELGSVESKYGKRVISYREWIDPENAVSACEIEKKETVKDVCDLLESELKRWSKGNDSSEAKYRTEMLKELIEKINEN